MTGEEEQTGAEAAEKLAPIDIGDSLPNLTLKDEKNEDIQIADLASEGGVVLFLVPKADTRKHL
jgi:peroxiredoxin Q/BCP